MTTEINGNYTEKAETQHFLSVHITKSFSARLCRFRSRAEKELKEKKTKNFLFLPFVSEFFRYEYNYLYSNFR